MSNPKRTAWIAGIIVSACLAVAAYWIKVTPLASIPSKSVIGKLDLTQKGASLQVGFVAPESLTSVTVRFPNVMNEGKGRAHPTFPLALRLRVRDDSGTNVWDELVERDRMNWTNWHPGSSLLLSIQSWLAARLVTNKSYVLTLTVEKPAEALGEAEVYLHWMDRAYFWGAKRQSLTIIPDK